LRRAMWAIIALTLVVAACGEENPLVATVNGRPITLGYIQALHPFEESELGGPDFAIVLRDSIVQEIVVQAAREEFDLERDESEVEARLEEIRADIEGGGTTWESFLEAQRRTDAEMQELAFQLVLQQQIVDRLIADVVPLTDAELRARYDEQLQWLAQVCVRHILVETGPEAQAALDRLGKGEAFAAVAAEISTDSFAADGGNLGCAPPAGYVSEFAAATLEAPLDQPFGPVETRFGFHIVLVESRSVPTFEEAVPMIEAGRINAPQRFSDWLNGAVEVAEVQIEPQFGSWTLTPTAAVLPPAEE